MECRPRIDTGAGLECLTPNFQLMKYRIIDLTLRQELIINDENYKRMEETGDRLLDVVHGIIDLNKMLIVLKPWCELSDNGLKELLMTRELRRDHFIVVRNDGFRIDTWDEQIKNW